MPNKLDNQKIYIYLKLKLVRLAKTSKIRMMFLFNLIK